MKFLIHSNGPNVSTGYGVQCAQLIEMLDGDGHDVAVSCTYGQQGSVGRWPIPGADRSVRLYPVGYEVNSNDVIHNHARHHFGGDDLDGWIITLIDVWAMHNPLLADFQVAAWCPVDHFPVPPGVLEFFRRTDAVPLSMSRFGEKLLFDAGLDPVYIPLSVDTRVMRPTPTLDVPGKGTVTARQIIGVPEDAFVVGMVAMNKGWAKDRKGFNEALRAFGAFWKQHQDAVLYLHCDAPGGADGMNLHELAVHAAVPEHAIRFVDQYAYRIGLPQPMMAAAYTAMDVLIAPSHGEGFCVPLIEAQACGTPVIATNFSAQPELVGAGWLVGGQPEWDPPQHASYVVPFIAEIVARLEDAYEARGDAALATKAVGFARQYDTRSVYDTYWRPFLDTLEPRPVEVTYDRSPIPDTGGVAVIVPAMRPENMDRLVSSFDETNDGSASLLIVHEADYPRTTFAEKVNLGFENSTEPWVLIVGDDVEFKPGWIEAARKLSDRYDVIGTNDTSGPVKNPDVAAGTHADHFFVRRAYVEAEGGCLDGPGVLAPECYRHWWVDREIVGLAKARGVFTPCLESVVEHHHPGYDGREDLRQADPVYMKAVESAADDQRAYQDRLALIEMQRVTRSKR